MFSIVYEFIYDFFLTGMIYRYESKYSPLFPIQPVQHCETELINPED